MSGYQQLGRDAPKELGDDAVWKSKMNKRKLLSVVLGAAVVCLNFIFPVFAVSATLDNNVPLSCPAT